MWTKISGPLTFTIADASAVRTKVNSFVQGVYRLELKVTDAAGLFSKDTVVITVRPVSPVCDNSTRAEVTARLTPIGTLSKPRQGMAVAAAGNKIVFCRRIGVFRLPGMLWFFKSRHL